MGDLRNNKVERVLGIYTKLINGYLINKAEEANFYSVNERSIQRDIDDIRNFLEVNDDNDGFPNTVVYDRIEKGYRLERSYKSKLTNSEILALCKILLDSRAFTKNEMTEMLKKLIEGCVSKSDQKLITDLINNELFHYVEPRHKIIFKDTMWSIGQAIRNCQFIEIDYYRMKDKAIVKRKVKPVAIMFSEYYFYMTAFIDDEETRANFDVLDDAYPTVYRIDRIKKLETLSEKFHVPYKDRFQEGEFRKRVQFMYGGRLRKVKFKYSGISLEAVLDKLPTAKVLSEEDGKYLISAEVFGNGIDMWLRSQGNCVELL